MDAWIKYLDHPLVLVGFVLFVFARLLKELLSHNVIRFNQVQSAQLMNKGLNFALVLAILAMVAGFLSQKDVLLSLDKQPAKVETPGNSITGTTITGSTINQAGAMSIKVYPLLSAVAREKPKNNTIDNATINNSKLNQAGGNVNLTQP